MVLPFYSSRYDAFKDIDALEAFNCVPEVNAVINMKANARKEWPIQSCWRQRKRVSKRANLKAAGETQLVSGRQRVR